MNNLFKKVACFTDIHFGNKNNSTVFNDDCTDFVKWFCEQSIQRGAETCIFLGDWHHTRNTINVSTLNYTMKNLELLSNTFKMVYIITGNHDQFYREKRDIHSLPMISGFNNIVAINDISIEGNVALIPWLVQDEWSLVKHISTARYVFGHFEIPGFKLNAQIVMPDHGTINKTHFKNMEWVFSGHFHRRQLSENICYIGNPFGHDYSAAMDFDHGAMFLEWGGVPEFVNWDEQPRYITVKLSDLMIDQSIISHKCYIRCEQDIDITYEESMALKEAFSTDERVREFTFVHRKDEQAQDEDLQAIPFESIDSVIIDQIQAIDSEKYNKSLLMDIYNSL